MEKLFNHELSLKLGFNFDVVFKKPIKFTFNFDEIRNLAVEKYGEELGEMTPSFFPDEHSVFNILKPEKRKGPHFTDFQYGIRYCDMNLSFSNIHGLVILELMDEQFELLEKDVWYLGMDNPENLRYFPGHGHKIPALKKEADGHYSNTRIPWGGFIHPDERIVIFS